MKIIHILLTTIITTAPVTHLYALEPDDLAKSNDEVKTIQIIGVLEESYDACTIDELQQVLQKMKLEKEEMKETIKIIELEKEIAQGKVKLAKRKSEIAKEQSVNQAIKAWDHAKAAWKETSTNWQQVMQEKTKAENRWYADRVSWSDFIKIKQEKARVEKRNSSLLDDYFSLIKMYNQLQQNNNELQEENSHLLSLVAEMVKESKRSSNDDESAASY